MNFLFVLVNFISFKKLLFWCCLYPGWHICSVCQKAAHYMCYTCTYSLCKGCTKDADFLCVRGDKGFCGTCMRTVMLIENKEKGNQEMVCILRTFSTNSCHFFR